MVDESEEKNWVERRNCGCSDSGYLDRRKGLGDRVLSGGGKGGKEYGGM